jgi:hypothetical protein
MSPKVFELVRSLAGREFDFEQTMHVLTADRNIWWSWGVSNGKCSTKWIVFKTNGHHHKGWVLITLGWEDLYKVRLITTHGRITAERDGLYFDQIVDYIDEKVEKISAYEH